MPRLSDLRSSAGETAIPRNTIERIQALVESGELPVGGVCPYSGRPADSTIYFHVQCERAWVRGGDSWKRERILVFSLLFGWIGAWVATRKPRAMQEFGRDTLVSLPLRVSRDCCDSIAALRRQRKLKRLLLTVPIYAELLREFPDARVESMKTALPVD